MTNPPAVSPSPSPWGTLTELLLAFAVSRHGTASWDSIASELQKRTSDPSLSITPQNCRSKYLDLKRRFLAPNHDILDDKSDAEASAPLLDELRKLRVAELRREVERYDLNIESLELKVKKMEEERDRSLKEESESADLEKKSVGNTRAEPAAAGESVAGEELAKDQLSVNESNSTDLRVAKLKAGEKDPEPAPTSDDDVRLKGTGQVSGKPSECKSEPDRKSVRADSCNGSSNSSIQAKREPENNSVGFLIEPGAESDGGVEVENSDMQSSASRSRKGERIDKLHRECEREDQSRAVKSKSAESQPLVDFLHSIRAHKFGSVFERRLRSQETPKYRKLVLQHIDLETIETRLKEGWYSGSSTKFFRDLLLLVNNALIFFGRKLPEAKAAIEIRQLISKEISQQNAKSIFSSRKQVSLHSLSVSKKEETKPSDSLALKPRISGSLIVCRKRSSIAAKASASDKKKEQGSVPPEGTKQHSEQSGNSDEPKITKKRTRDRLFSSSTPTGTKKSGKNESNDNNKNSFAESRKQQGKGGSSSSSQQAEPKNDNKKNQSAPDSKKRGAANFLSRMKQGSSSNNGALLDALKNRPLTSESTSSKGGSELKKNENTKRGEKKEAATKKITNSETSQGKEKEKEKEKASPGKRNVGRPPKRGAAPPSAVGKRGREKAEIETPPSKQPKKRARKS